MIVVAEQAGAGLLPPDPLSRDWLDLLGEATQALAAVAERALLVVAGRAIELPPGTGRRRRARRSDDEDLRHHGDTLVRPGDADHAVNVLAGGPPPWLREALARALDEDVAAYPRETETVAALAALHGRAPEEIVPTNGAAQALWLLPAALRPRLAACVHPGFTETEAALRAHGVPTTRVLRDPEDGFALRPRGGARGGRPRRRRQPRLAERHARSRRDDPRSCAAPAARSSSTRRSWTWSPASPPRSCASALPDVIVVRSLTKALAIPGLRAGYAVAPTPLADRLRAVRPPWSCNALALAALRAMAERPAALAEGAVRAQAERVDLEQRLRAGRRAAAVAGGGELRARARAAAATAPASPRTCARRASRCARPARSPA